MHTRSPRRSFSRHLFGAVALLPLAVACASGNPSPAHPGNGSDGPPNPPMEGQICTEIGCVDGFRVDVKKDQWEAGEYSFHIEADGNVSDCTGSLPLKPCESGSSISCTGSQGFTIAEVGCAMAPAQQAFGEIHFEGAPKQVTISISRDGSELIKQVFEPVYTESQPNGPGCEPICHQASASVTIGSAQPGVKL
ncbi:MAG: hypothetical protein R3B89_07985 [Polyangiaceae bacterium]